MSGMCANTEGKDNERPLRANKLEQKYERNQWSGRAGKRNGPKQK